MLLKILEPFVPSSRNYRFSNVGTHASQSWNRAFPIQKTAGSQRLESILPKLGTIGFQFWELPGPKRWPQNFEILHPRIANSGKRRSPKNGTNFPRLEPWVPSSTEFRFPKVEIVSCNLKHQNFLVLFARMMNSQGLEAMFPSFDTSFISKNCGSRGCTLGIRLNINFCNKPLLLCLMDRQKDVYLYMYFDFERTCKRCFVLFIHVFWFWLNAHVKRCCVVFIHVFWFLSNAHVKDVHSFVYTCIFHECTCKRCCVENVVFVLFNGPISIEALVETCISDRHEKHVR